MNGIRVQELMTNKFRNWDFYTSPVTEGRILIIWSKVFVKIILGDFNAIFTARDRSGGKPVSKMELLDSSQWLAVNHLEALKSTGSFFTWTNNQDGSARIYSKIDHVFINEEWLDMFPNTSAMYNWETISDHCSCTISVMTVENMGVKLFRFYNFLAYHVNFKQMVLDSWRKPLKGTGVHFQKSKDQYQEALFLAQLHPINLALQDKVKVTAENFRIQEQIGIMGRPSSASKQCVEMGSKLSLDQQLLLLNPFTHKEIRDAMFNISTIKSPGPDGYGSTFFKVLWQDIGDEVCRAIGQFFETDDLLLFCKGSLSTVKVLKNVIGEFSSVTGLQINESKSQVYFGGVSAAEKLQISAELNLSEGSFPLKYLGVPMRPTKWKHEDCDIIIQKIKMRLHTWASRHLSFAGRMQLIHSVLLDEYFCPSPKHN
ncbi:uncharacterized protein LOC133832334 [Humulus lupulus]|uniref:uncharacterized protein LOC133832334 n=1 Tax=Humulus lupulus TaxID=3486 RepID=UPI002B4012AB|nr:uncharacterized protein LOC133832334 [Humulus lupulus]